MKNYDILHFHDENDLSLLTFSALIKKPKIFHYHILSISLPYLMQKEKLLCKYFLKKAITYHIVNSGYSKRLLENMGMHSNRIFIIPNAIDLTEYAPKFTKEKKSKTYCGTKKILYISRLSFEKLDSVESVINSAPILSANIPNFEIIIVGTGPYYDYVKELGGRVNKKLNKKIITLLGKVEEDRKRTLINSSDIVVGVSRVALEAMAYGKPVLVSGDKFIEGKPDAYFGGIVTEKNSEELKYYNFCYRPNSEKVTPAKIAEAALKLLADERYASEIGAFGKEFVRKEYDSRKIAKQLQSIYKTLEN